MIDRVFGGLMLLGFLAGAASAGAEEPKWSPLSTEEQALLAKSGELNGRVLKLYGESKFAEAVDLAEQVLEIRRRVYTRDRYPDGHPELATGINNLAAMHRARGEYEKSRLLFEESLGMNRALYPKSKHPDGHTNLAMSIVNLATVYESRGEYAKAQPLLEEGLEMVRSLYPKSKFPDGHPELSRGMNNLASLHHSRGEYEKAQPLYEEAVRINRSLYLKSKHPDGHPQLASSINNLAVLYRTRGDYEKAQPLSEEALKIRRSLYPSSRYPDGHNDLATSISNLAILHRSRGDYEKARLLLEEALGMHRRLFPKSRYPVGHPDLARNLDNLANLHESRREYTKAQSLQEEALRMRRSLYPKSRYPVGHPELAKSINNLGELYRTLGEYAKAQPLLEEGLEMVHSLYPKSKFPDGHPELASSLSNLAALHRSRREHEKAQPLYEEAVRMNRLLYPKSKHPNGHPELSVSISNLANIYQIRGEYEKSQPLFLEAMRMDASFIQSLSSTGSEAQTLNYLASRPLNIDAYISTSLTIADSDSYPAVWDSAAHVTRLYSRRQLALVVSGSDPEVAKDYFRLRVLRREREQLLLAPVAPDPAARDERLERLGRTIRELEIRVAAALPTFRKLESPPPTTPDNLRSKLPPGALLIDFRAFTRFREIPNDSGINEQTRTNEYLAFVVTRERTVAVQLGELKPIDEAVKEWRQAISDGLPGLPDNTPARAARVRRMVWDPIAKHLPKGTNTIFISPDGELSALPWAAMPSHEKNGVLLDEFLFCLVPHGPALLEQLTAPPSPKPDVVLSVGGVRYKRDRSPTGLLAVKSPLPSDYGDIVGVEGTLWLPLPGSETEFDQLAASHGKNELLKLQGDDATAERVALVLPKVRFAHLATHGYFADAKFRSVLQLDEKLYARRSLEGYGTRERIGEGARNPLVLSGLVFAGANHPDTPNRGILSADSIVSLDLRNMDLAVLSACETGLGEVNAGEGVYGLQRAFHIAGCRNVIASLWKVPDQPTAALMAKFYFYLWEKKLTPAQSLRLAQLDILRSTPEQLAKWAKGEDLRGASPRPRQALIDPKIEPAPEPAADLKLAPTKWWAAFTISGSGTLTPEK